jgi:hypothetical protein
MLIRDNKFDEFTLPDISTSFGQCLETNLSTYGGRSNMSVHPKPRNVLLLHTLNSIDVCAIERPPHTTGIQVSDAQGEHKGS